jgi:phenylalanyl-tRNA synthetase alpha chain
MVHPAVLAHCGIDAEKYRGWAFGFGVERIAMRKYAIGDIRALVENDLRFLSQM